jgi:hypothetical protein
LVRLMNTWNWSGHNARSPRSRPAEEVIPHIAGEWDRRQGRDAHWPGSLYARHRRPGCAGAE